MGGASTKQTTETKGENEGKENNDGYFVKECSHILNDGGEKKDYIEDMNEEDGEDTNEEDMDDVNEDDVEEVHGEDEVEVDEEDTEDVDEDEADVEDINEGVRKSGRRRGKKTNKKKKKGMGTAAPVGNNNESSYQTSTQKQQEEEEETEVKSESEAETQEENEEEEGEEKEEEEGEEELEEEEGEEEEEEEQGEEEEENVSEEDEEEEDNVSEGDEEETEESSDEESNAPPWSLAAAMTLSLPLRIINKLRDGKTSQLLTTKIFNNFRSGAKERKTGGGRTEEEDNSGVDNKCDDEQLEEFEKENGEDERKLEAIKNKEEKGLEEPKRVDKETNNEENKQSGCGCVSPAECETDSINLNSYSNNNETFCHVNENGNGCDDRIQDEETRGKMQKGENEEEDSCSCKDTYLKEETGDTMETDNYADDEYELPMYPGNDDILQNNKKDVCEKRNEIQEISCNIANSAVEDFCQKMSTEEIINCDKVLIEEKGSAEEKFKEEKIHSEAPGGEKNEKKGGKSESAKEKGSKKAGEALGNDPQNIHQNHEERHSYENDVSFMLEITHTNDTQKIKETNAQKYLRRKDGCHSLSSLPKSRRFCVREQENTGAHETNNKQHEEVIDICSECDDLFLCKKNLRKTKRKREEETEEYLGGAHAEKCGFREQINKKERKEEFKRKKKIKT